MQTEIDVLNIGRNVEGSPIVEVTADVLKKMGTEMKIMRKNFNEVVSHLIDHIHLLHKIQKNVSDQLRYSGDMFYEQRKELEDSRASSAELRERLSDHMSGAAKKRKGNQAGNRTVNIDW
jgi:hypothetical protein